MPVLVVYAERVRNALLLQQVQNLGEATSKFIDEGLDKKAIADLQDAFQVN
jgi:hypothetical protein